MNRNEVVAALRAANVDIPVGVGVAQLRALLQQAQRPIEAQPDVNADDNRAPDVDENADDNREPDVDVNPTFRLQLPKTKYTTHQTIMGPQSNNNNHRMLTTNRSFASTTGFASVATRSGRITATTTHTTSCCSVLISRHW